MSDDPLTLAVLTGMKRAGVSAGARILVAVSGGPDSVALLSALRDLASDPDRHWRLRVGHVNHELRGEESETDAEFVLLLARRLGLEVEAVRVDTAAHAAQRRLTLEAAGRELRYAALDSMLERWPGDVIATGHTQDDQAETLLLRLLRGTGLIGLGAMRWRSGAIVRPLLDVRRETILAALQARGQGYRVDSSNLHVQHQRNRVREDVLPRLEAIQPRTVELVARTASLLQSDGEYLLREALEALQMLDLEETVDGVSASQGVWRAMHPALRSMTLRLLLGRLAGRLQDVEESHIARLEAMLGRPGITSLECQLPHGINAYVEGGRFLLRRGGRRAHTPAASVELHIPGRTEWTGGVLTATHLSASDLAVSARLLAVCGPLHALCDEDALGGRLIVRAWRPGDRMRPLGMNGSRKLQDIFGDRKIPRAHRGRIPVIENGGFIVWIPGVVLDERVAIRGWTSRAVHLAFASGSNEEER